MSQDLILEAEGVCKHFGRLQVLHGVDPVSYTHLTLPTSDLV